MRLGAEPPPHALRAASRLAANRCGCLCRVGKGKTIHPKTKGWGRRKKPTQEQRVSTIQTKQRHRERGKRCEGGDAQTKPQNQTSSARGGGGLAPQRVAPTLGVPQHGDLRAEPVMGTCRGRFWRTTQRAGGKTKASRKIRRRHPPGGQSHPLGESWCPAPGPRGSQGIRHHRAGTLPRWHTLKESRAAAGTSRRAAGASGT